MLLEWLVCRLSREALSPHVTLCECMVCTHCATICMYIIVCMSNREITGGVGVNV